MATTMKQAVDQGVEAFTDAFYFAAQSLIGQDDGGLASHYESDDRFKNGTGRALALAVASAVGVDVFIERGHFVGTNSDAPTAKPLVANPSELTDELVNEVALKVVEQLRTVLQRAFPSLDMLKLARIEESLVKEAADYLRFEQRMSVANGMSL